MKVHTRKSFPHLLLNLLAAVMVGMISNGFAQSGVSGINWTNLLQRIDGFGGGVVFLNDVSDPVSATFMNTAYGTNANQLALTLLRVRIAPNEGWTNNNYSSWATSLSDAQKAVAWGAGVLATPWTPPASMKDNNSLTNGGSVLPSQYGNYALYLKSFADYMASNGAPLRAISIQNEPDFVASYESCIWTSTEFLNFFRTNASAITAAPVMMPESEDFNFALSDPTLNDSVAVTNVAIVGGHLYGNGNAGAAIVDYANAHNKGKPTWMTEFLVNDQTIGTAITTAKQVHDCLTTGNMSAYIWWKCFGDANGLVDASGVPQPRGFVMAQFSRFVRPGWLRIGVTNDGSEFVSAYRDTNSTSFAIVAINTNATPQTLTFNLQNFPVVASVVPWTTSSNLSLAVQSAVTVTNTSFSYSLPGTSIVTFVAQTNSPPSLAPVANQTINAGVTLMVTNVASDPDLPAQTLTFTLLGSPTNATLTKLNPTNASVIWRPLVSQANTTNLFTVEVADNGSPSLSATNNFTVTVNPLGSPPSVSSIVAAPGNSLDLTIAGPVGPDYTVLTSTNLFLSGWQWLLTSNSPVTPFVLPVTNQSDPVRFYRIQIGP